MFDDKNYKIILITVGVSTVTALILIKKKYFSRPYFKSSLSLKDKVVIVTGGNSGLGFATCLDLAKREATVILACRDHFKGQEAMKFIRKQSRNQNVFFEKIDLANLDSVKSFAEKIMANYKCVDILINNAGVMSIPYQKTTNGFEYQFQVNYLSHYLLTRLIMNNRSAFPKRIINLTSKLYESGTVNFDDLNMDNDSFTPILRYKQSKLCLILFSNYLNLYLQEHHFEGTNVYSVSPGIVRTNLGRYIFQGFSLIKKALAYALYPLFILLTANSEKGAQTIIFCALKEELKSGFYRNCEKVELLEHARNTEDEQKLWFLSEKMVEKWLN